MSVPVERLFNTEALDAKSLDFLLNALKANTQAGLDYLKFKQSISTLQNTMGLSEEMAVKSAFATASTLGITKDQLLSSILHYNQILQKEKTEFDNAHAKQKNLKVNQKQNDTVFLQEKIVSHKAQILELEKQIKEFQAKIDNSDKEIEEARQKIQETKLRFDEAFTHFEKALKSDTDTFNKYL